MISWVCCPVILCVWELELVLHDSYSISSVKGNLIYSQEVHDHVSRSIATLDFFYLALDFTDLVTHWAWICVIIKCTLSHVSITLNMTVIEPFSKVLVMQLII